MAEKNDDIKQLFAHLGLNPGDYKELRNPPKTTAAREESQESRRNWSLLRAVRVGSADRPAEAPATVVTATPVAAPQPVPSMPPTLTAPNPLPRPEARLLPAQASADSIERDVRDLSRAELERESLQSFFEAVKEPVSPAALDVPQDAPSIPQTTERRATEHLLDELRRVPETAAARVADLVRSRWPQDRAVGQRPEPVAAPMPAAITAPAPAPAPSSLPPAAPVTPAPVLRPASVAATPAAAPEPAAVPAGLLRLQFGAPKPAAAAPAATGTETLADVFRRLAAADRPR